MRLNDRRIGRRNGAAGWLAGVLLAGCGGAAPPPEQAEEPRPKTSATEAVAEIYPAGKGSAKGTLVFRATDKGVLIRGRLAGLSHGSHGFGVHEHGDCTAHDGKSAGPLFNPKGAAEPLGLLGDLEVGEEGQVRVRRTEKKLAMSGPESIVGRSFVIHAWPYDPEVEIERLPFVGCGVIRGK